MILIDTREQANKHILRVFDRLDIDYCDTVLTVGDYSSTESDVVVERKKDLAEFAGNCGKGHHRFKRELERAKDMGIKVVVLIEQDTTFEGLRSWVNPRGKVTYRKLVNGEKKPIYPMCGEQIAKICEAWMSKYDLEVKFCDKSESAEKILKILEA